MQNFIILCTREENCIEICASNNVAIFYTTVQRRPMGGNKKQTEQNVSLSLSLFPYRDNSNSMVFFRNLALY